MNNQRFYSNEIQIELDDVYGCPGHCPGCVLSTIEKKNVEPDMLFSTLQKSFEKLSEFVPTLEHLEKINVTYGIADHFLMSNEYLEKTFLEAAQFIQKMNLSNPHNGVFYTSSMIGKSKHILEKVQYLQKISQKMNVPFYIIAVLDPKNLYRKNFADVYKKNIIETNRLIGKVDLSINLSDEAISYITPQELFDFAKMNDFDEVTINWTPTFDNLQFVYMEQNQLANWLIAFDQLIQKDEKLGTSFRPVILRTLHNLECKKPQQELSFQENLSLNLPELIYKSIQIDHQGNIFPKYEAIGDIPHSPRLHFQEIGNVHDLLSISEMFSQFLPTTKKYVIKQFLKEPCSSCSFNQYCANTGFHIYNHVLNEAAKNHSLIRQKIYENIQQNQCLHIGKKIFNYYHQQEQNKYLDE